jgi:uncharacterized small protein (TIGR04563 family)
VHTFRSREVGYFEEIASSAPTLTTRLTVSLLTVRHDTMAGSDKRKQSLYFPEEMLREIQDEAARQDRSLSWIVQKAWKIARKDIMKYPSVNEFPGAEDELEAK